jgi:HAD superfamily hydrolase (TIGR01484 family)
MQISAILSDYDGTLCPTASIKSGYGSSFGTSNNKIPEELEKTLIKISRKIPICVISSKDFRFLHETTQRFAKILSCILGIETIVHKEHDKNRNDLDCVITRHLALGLENQLLTESSTILKNLVGKVSKHWKDIIIERKFTSEGTLVGLTFDYRQLQNWNSFKEHVEPPLKEFLQHQIDKHMRSLTSYTPNQWPFIQTYSTHPFVDVYAVKCNKGSAFDQVFSELSKLRTFATSNNNKSSTGKENNIVYLGDSENDNPAFRKASVSIGIISDTRLNPKLDCQYSLGFSNLSDFLKRLVKADFVFSHDLLIDSK